MNKGKLKISFGVLLAVLIFGFFVKTNHVDSAFFIKGFAIKVTALKALPIQEKENAGYVCKTSGQTIEGKVVTGPKGTPTSYYIGPGVKAKGGGTARTGKQIMGLYSNAKQPIICIRPPADIAVVNLDSVVLWSTPASLPI